MPQSVQVQFEDGTVKRVLGFFYNPQYEIKQFLENQKQQLIGFNVQQCLALSRFKPNQFVEQFIQKQWFQLLAFQQQLFKKFQEKIHANPQNEQQFQNEFKQKLVDFKAQQENELIRLKADPKIFFEELQQIEFEKFNTKLSQEYHDFLQRINPH